jgi:hypothetical protein
MGIVVWAIARNKQARDRFAGRPWATALALSLIAVASRSAIRNTPLAH